MFSFLVVFVLVGMYGGCGSSGGGNNPPPTNSPPTNAPPTDPPPTNPPPTDPPPLACEIPALNSDFSDTGYFFFDPFTGLTMGVTSNGELVVIAIVDSMGVSVGAGAFPLGEFGCSIFEGVVGEAVFDADGLCGKSDDSTLFLILDFEIIGVPFVNEAIGECFAVEPLSQSVSQKSENDSVIDPIVKVIQELTFEAFLDKQSRGELGDVESEGIIFGDILEEFNNELGD